MPLATIHLIELADPSQLVSFLHALKKLQPLVVAKVVRWIIRPTAKDAEVLLGTPWDLMVILPAAAASAQKSNLDGPGLDKLKMVKSTWSVTVGIPSRLTKDFGKTNDRLLHPSTKPELTGALDHPRLGESSQTLELSRELLEWINNFSQTKTGRSPLSMLNLLAFKPNMKESYLKYGRAFFSMCLSGSPDYYLALWKLSFRAAPLSRCRPAGRPAHWRHASRRAAPRPPLRRDSSLRLGGGVPGGSPRRVRQRGRADDVRL